MLEWIASWGPAWTGLLGSLIAGLGTGVGALLIFFRKSWSDKAQVMMLAVAAGVMLGATVFSLIVPALAIVTERSGSSVWAAAVTSAGIALGALSVWALHAFVPHRHFTKGPEGQVSVDLGKHWLFILAITLHNFPEGMSVGVSFGHELHSGVAVMFGIGLQNLPEGLAVAAALAGEGSSRLRAFVVALLTGLVEPVGGLVGVLAVGLAAALLPWALAFAAGAMLFVVSGEVIPETHRQGAEQVATFSLVLGFIVMMSLDGALG